ncbi:MAG: hypothetical protein WCI45_00170 [Desulfuromonadales bacterium]
MKTENEQVVKRGRPPLGEDEALRRGRIIVNLPPERAKQVKRLALARNLSYSKFCTSLLLPELDKLECTA